MGSLQTLVILCSLFTKLCFYIYHKGTLPMNTELSQASTREEIKRKQLTMLCLLYSCTAQNGHIQEKYMSPPSPSFIPTLLQVKVHWQSKIDTS